MKKSDLLAAVLVLLLIPVWMYVDQRYIAPRFRRPAPAQRQKSPAAVEKKTPASSGENAAGKPAAETAPELRAARAEKKTEQKGSEEEEAPARIVELANAKLRLKFSSRGGTLLSATLVDYPQYNRPDSPPVVLDFSDAPALAYAGIEGADCLMRVRVEDDGNRLVFTRRLPGSITFRREVRFRDDYLVEVHDRFTNEGLGTWEIPPHRILTGRMRNGPETAKSRYYAILGADSFTPAGGIMYWGRKLHKLYKLYEKTYGIEAPLSIDIVPPGMENTPVDWVSAKNKFFVQILRPDDPVATISILSARDPAKKRITPVDIAASLDFKSERVAPGAATEYIYTFYVGPKKYSILKAAGNHMEKVMEFQTIGFFSWMNWLMEPARKALLWTLNKLYAVTHNYGVAIILLTLLVRILFWPLTHKSYESMQRMQELQPKLKALQAKYKNNPKKLQQAQLELYRAEGVNPMGGCLPMLVQIPIFIALYTVLRNAIELRYAHFLWIADLSAPENLFAGKIPLVGSLNILPLLMAASMVWQQKITSPPALTPEQKQQQEMMGIMMPIMLLVMLYKMPSGLALYWTTSNFLVILQSLLRKRRQARAQA